MKLLLFILFFIAGFFINYSIEQTENPDSTTATPKITDSSTKPRPLPQKRTTTLPNRVSTTVLIAVPIAVAGATLLIGYGLIAYAVITGGNGLFFLTRTNERLIP
jgi:hypothetical protein